MLHSSWAAGAFAGLLLLAVFSATFAHAAEYPACRITFVVVFAPGGGIDIFARALAHRRR